MRFLGSLLAKRDASRKGGEYKMTYTKPKVSLLGSACALIERIPQKANQLGDDGHDAPAYDLDE
jgi:hypothetical protein